jgi:GGDEF domain-containing protein
MARIVWKNRSWLRKFVRHLRSTDGAGAGHGPIPESYFLEKLTLEGKRALRSHKPLVVMIIDAEHIAAAEGTGAAAELGELLGEEVSGCIRESDICGLLRKDTLIGVILTEVEAEKIGSAQLIVARKTRERLSALLSLEQANRIAISFRIFPATDGKGLIDLTSHPDQIAGSDPARS